MQLGHAGVAPPLEVTCFDCNDVNSAFLAFSLLLMRAYGFSLLLIWALGFSLLLLNHVIQLMRCSCLLSHIHILLKLLHVFDDVMITHASMIVVTCSSFTLYMHPPAYDLLLSFFSLSSSLDPLFFSIHDSCTCVVSLLFMELLVVDDV